MIQLQILNKVLTENDLSILDNNGIGEDYFSEYLEEYQFIVNHRKRYGNIPDDESMLEKFQGFQLLDVQEGELYLVEKLREEHMYNAMVPILQQAAEEMQSDSNSAVANLMPKVQKLMQEAQFIGGIDIAKDAAKRLEWAIEIKEHEGELLGIPTGFELLDDILGGMLPGEDLIVVAGRPGDGKSWTIDKMMSTAWKLGNDVLLYSGEMSEFQVGARIDTLISNVSINSITKGLWNDNTFKNYEDHITMMEENGTALTVVTPKMLGGRAMTTTLLDSMIQKYNPKVVGIDQLSLMKESTYSREPLRVQYANIAKELYELSTKYGIPIVLNVQASRASKDSMSGNIELEHIAESDGVGQNASRVITMKRDEANQILQLTVAKNRYGEDNKTIEYVWDLQTGSYTLVGFKDDDEEGGAVDESPGSLKSRARRATSEVQRKVSREGVEAF